MKEELSKKSFQLIDDYIKGRQELSLPVYNKLKAQLNLCIQELEDLVWNRTCDPSQYDKLKKRLALYEYMEKEMQKVFKFYKELGQDKNRREFYKVGKDDQEEKIVMKMKIIRVIKKKDSKKVDMIDIKTLKSDYDALIKECKECKKKIDKILDSGNIFQLIEARSIFTRAARMLKEFEQEQEQAIRDWWNEGQDKEIGKSVMDMNPDKIRYRLSDIEENLARTVPGLTQIKDNCKELRKINFI